METTEPQFGGHFLDLALGVKPEVKHFFVKQEVSEEAGFTEIGETEGQVGGVDEICGEPMLSGSLISPSGGLQLQISDVRSLRSDGESGNFETDVREPSSSMTMFSVNSGGEFQDKTKDMRATEEEKEMDLSFRDQTFLSDNDNCNGGKTL